MTGPRQLEPSEHRRVDDRPVLPVRPDSDNDAAWGDEPSERDDEWYRRERPPHHE